MRLSIVVLTINEEEMIEGCLKSAKGLGEILVIDDCSTDKTLEIASSIGRSVSDRKKPEIKVFVHKMKDFSDQRNFGLKKATGDWIFYLDADERMTTELKDEISSIINHQSSIINSQSIAFLVQRRNFYLGREMFSDKVHRLFKKKNLKGWKGPLHESPKVYGLVGELKNPLIHFAHRSILAMLKKTGEWSEVEADLRLKAGHPPVSWWRILRVMMGEFYEQFFRKKIWRFKTEGFIEGVFQVFSIFITYVRLWEKQRKKSLSESYRELEKKVV